MLSSEKETPMEEVEEATEVPNKEEENIYRKKYKKGEKYKNKNILQESAYDFTYSAEINLGMLKF